MDKSVPKDIKVIETKHVRDIVLDYAKGFATILIVLYHIYGYTDREVGSIVNSFCYTVQLPIFFFISGLLIGKNQTHDVNLKKKAIRLITPFLFFYTIWCIINYNNLTIFIHDEFKGGYWFTFVLFEMMTTLSLSHFFSKEFNISAIIVQIVLFLLLTLYIHMTKGYIINSLLSLNLLWHYSPFFYLGIYNCIIKETFKIRFLFLYTPLLLITQYFFYISNNRFLIPICNFTSLFFFITLFKNGVRFFEQPISQIGKYSLHIYLLHFFFLYYFSKYIPLINNRYIEFTTYIVLSLVIISIIVTISQILMRNKWTRLVLFGIK